ncbi:MAG: oligosaccharide flippase family protein, partial [Elusimicrobia bacterium]|nr:oligosaccharide flippase family protein [Elusimicrobiota bacterium]
FNALGQVALAAINFLAVPILVRRLGLEVFGVYIIMHAAASYLVLASMGAGSAVIKHVAAGQGARDRRAFSDTLRYAGWAYTVGTLAGGAALWVWAEPVARRAFHVPASLLPTAVFALRCVAASGLFAALAQCATSVMQGLQRFDGHTATVVFQNALIPLGGLALVSAGFGLRAVAGWYAAVTAATCVLAWALALRIMRPVWSSPEGEGLPASTFGIWAVTGWLGGLAWIVAYQFDKLFIARSMSLAALTFYAVPAGMLQRLQVIPGLISTVAVPMMSELQGPEARAGVQRMYFKSSRFVLWVCLPVIVALFALMPQFLSLWLGGHFSDATCWPARLLALAQICFLLNAGPNTVTFSRDHPWYAPVLAWSQAALSLVFWRLLIPRWGLMGVALGSLAALGLPTGVNVWLVNRRVLGVPLRRYAAEVLFPPFASALLMLAVLMPFHARADGWVSLVGLAAAGAAVFYGSTWLLLNEEDRALLRRFLRWEGRG